MTRCAATTRCSRPPTGSSTLATSPPPADLRPALPGSAATRRAAGGPDAESAPAVAAHLRGCRFERSWRRPKPPPSSQRTRDVSPGASGSRRRRTRRAASRSRGSCRAPSAGPGWRRCRRSGPHRRSTTDSQRSSRLRVGSVAGGDVRDLGLRLLADRLSFDAVTEMVSVSYVVQLWPRRATRARRRTGAPGGRGLPLAAKATSPTVRPRAAAPAGTSQRVSPVSTAPVSWRAQERRCRGRPGRPRGSRR